MQPNRILIVEDEKIIAKDLEIRLKRMNYQVVGAVSNCDDCLAMLAEREADLILMDIMIDGDRDGIETAFLVKQSYDIPIIFLTAYADESTFQRAKLSDPFGYILKPFQERELDLTIQTVLQKHRYELRIKEDEERYRRLFESTQEAIIILDDDARVVDANPAAGQLYNITLSEMIGESLYVLNGSHDPDRFNSLWNKTLEEKKVEGRFKLIDRRGEAHYVDYSAQADYMPGRHLTVMRDATRKVLDQREIETLARIPAEAPNPIMRLTTEGDLIYANAPAEPFKRAFTSNEVFTLPPELQKMLNGLTADHNQATTHFTIAGRTFSMLAVLVPRSHHVNIYATDITDTQFTEGLMQLQKEVLELVATSSPLHVTLSRIADGLKQFLLRSEIVITWKRRASHQCEVVASFAPAQKASLQRFAEAVHPHYFDNDNNANQATASGKVGEVSEYQLVAKYAFPNLRAEAPLDYTTHLTVVQGELEATITILNPENIVVGNTRHNLINLGVRLAQLAVERDVSYRRLYNQGLAFESINDAIILTDLNGLITEWSPAAERIFGYSKGHMVGRRLVDAQIFAVELLQVDGQPKTDSVGVAETAFIRPGGGAGWVEISYLDMIDPSGTPVGRMQVARDITQKKLVERALNVSETHLQAIFDNSVQMFVLLDMQGKVEAFNNLASTWADTFGNKQLRKGTQVQSLWPTGNPSKFKECLKKAKTGEVSGYEDFFLTQNDEPVYFELNFLPVIDDRNKLTGICFTAIDIRERKNNELSLARSEARFRSLVQNSSDLIMLITSEGLITYVSESCQRVLGFVPEALNGHKLSDFVHARDKVRILDGLNSALEVGEGGSVALEYRFITEDKRIIHLESAITNQLYDTAIRSLVVNSRDITERKTSEDSLRNIVKGVTGSTGEDYFVDLTRNLSVYLNIPHVLLAELKDASMMETLSLVQDDTIAPSFRFAADQGFVADVFHSGYLYVNQVSNSAYAQDYLLRRFKAKTVIGVALKNSRQQNIGILIAASTRPLDNFQLSDSMLRIFSIRAQTELERIYATRALLESKANLTALIENTTDAIWSIDRDHRLTAQNASFRERFRHLFSDGLEIGDNLLVLMREKEARFWEPFLREALAGKRFSREISLSNRSQAINYEVSFNPILNDESEVQGVSIFARDITERKRAELALRQSEANLTALVENTDDVVYSIDANLRLLTANSSFSRVVEGAGLQLGRSRDLSAFKTGPFGKEWAEYYKRALAGEKFTQEFSLDINGQPADIETSFNPILTKERQVQGISIFARDITERKKAENELKQTNFELDSFVYRASHDLRAPLRSVLGLINLIRYEGDEAPRMNYLALAEKSINKLDNFISDLTHFSRNTRLEIVTQPIEFDGIIKECLDNLRYMERAEQVQSYIQINQEDVFYSDPGRISIIFQNLISNAIKYHRQEAESFVRIEIEVAAENCSIVVEDNGKGINSEYLSRIFDMFFRASEDSYGSGLGLYITRQVVEKLGGKIKVQSTLGEGTRFEMTLPNRPPLAMVEVLIEVEQSEEA